MHYFSHHHGPPFCKHPEIPILSMKAACDIFYGIYGERERSSIIASLLGRLDFHALSITLLATTVSHNRWDSDRLATEWRTQRAQVLQTDHNKSLAATIQLWLASPGFQSLGSDARDSWDLLLFFPKVSMKNTSTGFSPPSLTERTSFTNSVFFLYPTGAAASSLCWRQFETTLVPKIRNRRRSSARPGIVTSAGCRFILVLVSLG